MFNILWEELCAKYKNTMLHHKTKEITFPLNIKPKKCHLKESSGCGVKGLEGTLQNNEASNWTKLTMTAPFSWAS